MVIGFALSGPLRPTFFFFLAFLWDLKRKTVTSGIYVDYVEVDRYGEYVKSLIINNIQPEYDR